MKKFWTIFVVLSLFAVIIVSCKSRSRKSVPAVSDAVVTTSVEQPRAEKEMPDNTRLEKMRVDNERMEEMRLENAKVEERPTDNSRQLQSKEIESENFILTQEQHALLEKTLELSFRFLEKVHASTNENFVISPTSVEFLLAMVLNGADGKTADEIANTLGFGRNELTAANNLYQYLMKSFPTLDEKVIVNIANAMVVNQQIPLEAAFKKDAVKYYDAEMSNMDFRQSKMVTDKINAWCSKQTNGLIPSIIDKVDPSMMACLMNAVYFKGQWMTPFRKENTKRKTFTNESGKQSQVEMMMQVDRFRYAESAKSKWLVMPYGEGTYCMYVLLPNEGVAISELIADLNARSWNEILSSLKRLRVDVWFPKFETKYHAPLNGIMNDLGIKLAFTGKADFSKLSKVPSYISTIQQDAIIKVDETGTEAAAVTSAIFKATSVAMPAQPMVFHADHSFLYFIVEEQSGSILFAGQYNGN